MSSEEEAAEAEETSPEFHYLTIDLASPEDFDFSLFLELVVEKKEGEEALFFDRKYIVVGDKMFIFAEREEHSEVHDRLEEAGLLTGDLQSAGEITISSRKSLRHISRYSDSLKRDGKLTKEKSEKYKHGVIKEKLGDFFKIE